MVLRSTGGTVLKRRFAGFRAMNGVMEVEVEVEVDHLSNTPAKLVVI